MSGVEEAIEALRSLENNLATYLGYDSMVGGLVSRSIKTLAEAREKLSNPTRDNIQQALSNVQACIGNLSPYAEYAPELVRQANAVVEKLRSL